ncbi:MULTISPECIES: extracellular solute-binding protein [Sphingobium]|uniref:extracellular solute-binding protein n=1 Tax=Sphingobium TaxID=165695 RepID=UPI0015ECB9AC|nr:MULTISPECIES: extracellular solute-binding protein [Sphingobium]MCW2362767.1 microcin C transport system substrate-binding protein [Sphingobium sp. B10D3B]MCW2400552.1 microcin C transport system substrate-binding protein [Sphingobium sp. B10D7B]MCW2407531.1 microcin C transport system substrate-binding protein [Sphingobium xanthum]
MAGDAADGPNDHGLDDGGPPPPAGPVRQRLGVLRQLLLALLCLPLLLTISSASVQAVPGGNELISSHAYAVFGTPKYGPGFKHFDYADPKAPKGGTLRVAYIGGFDSLNLMALLGTPPIGMMQVYEPLMRRSSDEPAMRYALVAESITYPKDISWMDFHLDPRARWHDGVPITPEDIIFTIDQAKGLVTPSLKRLEQAVTRAEKRGPHTVRVYFTQPNNPTLPTVVMDMWLLPRHYYAKHALNAASLDRPLGSGPYKVGRFSQGRWIEYERVKDYWAKDLAVNKGRYNFDIIRHDYYRDQTVAYEAFLAGNVDFRQETSAVRWASEKQLPAFRAGQIKRQVIDYRSPSFYLGIVMNTRRPALADRQLRRALMLAYDFEWVRRTLLAGHHGRLHSFYTNSEFAAEGLPQGRELELLQSVRDEVPGEVFTKAPDLPVGGNWRNRRANLIEAVRILRAAGYRYQDGRLIDKTTGRPMALELISYSPLMDRQVSLFVENARQLGIAISFRSFDSAQFRHRLRHYDYDLLLNIPMFPGHETPSIGQTLIWGSHAADQPQSLNYPGVKNPAVDKMLAQMITATDRETVVGAMRALDRILLWNFYAIPFQHDYPAPVGQMPITYWDRFGMPKKQPAYNFPIMTLDTWWADPGKTAGHAQGQSS